MTYTIGGAGANTEFDGIIKDGTVGTVSLTKTGAGTLTLTNANTYSGGTIVSGGTLLVNNSGGSATGSGTVTVAGGGTLGGNGIISGAVTVNSGGTLTPGNPLGTLTIANSLTLSSGSACIMAVSHNGHTNDQIVSSSVSYGGTLTVITNAGDGPLVAGDTFQLFNSGTYGGGFQRDQSAGLESGIGLEQQPDGQREHRGGFGFAASAGGRIQRRADEPFCDADGDLHGRLDGEHHELGVELWGWQCGDEHFQRERAACVFGSGELHRESDCKWSGWIGHEYAGKLCGGEAEDGDWWIDAFRGEPGVQRDERAGRGAIPDFEGDGRVVATGELDAGVDERICGGWELRLHEHARESGCLLPADFAVGKKTG